VVRARGWRTIAGIDHFAEVNLAGFCALAQAVFDFQKSQSIL
jgi:hypothetical protein